MSLRTVMTEVEGTDFASRVSVASDAETFIEAVQSEAAVSELRGLLASEGNRSCLFLRLQALVYERSDTRYRNPRDAAIATYVWSLGATDPTMGNLAALTVQAEAIRCWWAVKLARLVLEGMATPKRSETTVVIANFETMIFTSSEPDGDLVFVLGMGRDPSIRSMIRPTTILVTGPEGQAREQWHVAASPQVWNTKNTGVAEA